MLREPLVPVIPSSEVEKKTYLGKLMLRKIEFSSDLGEAVLNSYYGKEPLGIGGEKVVFPHNNQEDRAVAFFHWKGTEEHPLTPEKLKENYYAIKLMHLLLPEHIPDAHFMSSEPPMIIVDKVQAQADISQEQFQALYREVREKARNLDVFIDPKPNNFLLDADQRVKYVDDFGLPVQSEKLGAAIKAIEDLSMRKAALRYALKAGVKLTEH